MRQFILAFLLPVFVFIPTINAQRKDESCSLNIKKMSADQLINEAPPDWNFGCLNKRILSEAISSKNHVNGIVDCLHPEFPVCEKEGYRVIAEEVLRRSDSSGRCSNCSPETAALVEYGLRLMQQRHPRLLRTALSYLG